MSDAEPTLAELIVAGVASGLQDIHVSMPGTIVSYDASKQTATVQPGVKRVIFDDDDQQVHEIIPPFENVPVMHYRCGKLSIHAVLEAGDRVDLIFGSDSMAEWRQGTEKVVAPGDLKRLGLSSPKAYPGLFPKNQPGPDHDNSIGTPGGLRIHFGETEISVGGGGDFVAMAAKVMAELNALKTVLTAMVSPLGSNAVVETAAAAAGLALSGQLATWPLAAGVASTNLKAD